MKKIIALLLTLVLSFSLCACGNGVSKKDKAEIIKIASETINKNIEEYKSGKSITKFSNYIDVDDVSYNITKVIKSNGEYIITIVFEATTNRVLDNTEKSLACYDMEELFTKCYYNGKEISIVGSDSKYGETYHHVSSWINGIEIHAMEKGYSNSSTNSGQKTKTCKFCDRKFSDSSNTMSIAKTGMCSNCTGNYKSMVG